MVQQRTAPGCFSYQWGKSVPPPEKLMRSGDLARMILPSPLVGPSSSMAGENSVELRVTICLSMRRDGRCFFHRLQSVHQRLQIPAPGKTSAGVIPDVRVALRLAGGATENGARKFGGRVAANHPRGDLLPEGPAHGGRGAYLPSQGQSFQHLVLNAAGKAQGRDERARAGQIGPDVGHTAGDADPGNPGKFQDGL